MNKNDISYEVGADEAERKKRKLKEIAAKIALLKTAA
jgi:hypothetical protein